MASIPEAPPLTKGFTVGHTPADFGFFSSPILRFGSSLEIQRGEEEKEIERESAQREGLLSVIAEVLEREGAERWRKEGDHYKYHIRK